VLLLIQRLSRIEVSEKSAFRLLQLVWSSEFIIYCLFKFYYSSQCSGMKSTITDEWATTQCMSCVNLDILEIFLTQTTSSLVPVGLLTEWNGHGQKLNTSLSSNLWRLVRRSRTKDRFYWIKNWWLDSKFALSFKSLMVKVIAPHKLELRHKMRLSRLTAAGSTVIKTVDILFPLVYLSITYNVL